MEIYLSRAFRCPTTNQQREEEDEFDFESIVPPHFYGELAKTDLGCQVLLNSGHVSEFARFIRQHGLESDDADFILKLKSILWAVVSCLIGWCEACLICVRGILARLRVA